MLDDVKRIYLSTRKKHDQLFNTYVMRPAAAVVVSFLAPTAVTPNQVTLTSLAVFIVAAATLAIAPGWGSGVLGLALVELSYLFDCADGMLARHKKIASKEGHLFDFFTDELKAVLLVGSLSIRLFRTGGYGADLTLRAAGDPSFLIAGVLGVAVVASAISLTNFIRRPELSGRETPVEAHYETVDQRGTRSLPGLVAWCAMTFLRFLNHYPSHLWLFALAGRLDLFFWIYVALNFLYLVRGWLGLAVRFGKS